MLTRNSIHDLKGCTLTISTSGRWTLTTPDGEPRSGRGPKALNQLLLVRRHEDGHLIGAPTPSLDFSDYGPLKKMIYQQTIITALWLIARVDEAMAISLARCNIDTFFECRQPEGGRALLSHVLRMASRDPVI